MHTSYVAMVNSHGPIQPADWIASGVFGLCLVTLFLVLGYAMRS